MSEQEKPNYRPETLALHAGYTADPTTGSRAVPIYQTTSYRFRDADHAARLFALKEFGNIYTRIMNPTNDVLEQRIAALEGGVAGLAVASGQAAETLALLTLLRSGDELVSTSSLYGGTYNLFKVTFPRIGIKTRFVEASDFDAIRAAIGPKTRALYAETLGNPRLDVVHLEELGKIAKEAGIPFVVDNTATTPALLRPSSTGRTSSSTRPPSTSAVTGRPSAGSSSTPETSPGTTESSPSSPIPTPATTGSGSGRRSGTSPSSSRPGWSSSATSGRRLSPFNAHAFITGLETLHLRVRRHSENALQVARWLQKDPRVAWVRYPGLEEDPAYPLARKYLEGGFGGLVAFGVKGGFAEGKALIDRVKLFSLLANIGDARSLIIHPASTTHQQLSPEEQRSTGTTEDLVRLSVGLEHPDDILADLDRSLGAR